MGIYINPDDIEKNIKTYGYFDFNDFEIESPEKEVLDFFKNSTLLKSFNLQDQISDLKYENNRLIFTNIDIITPPPNNLKNQQAYLTLGC